MWPRPSAVKLPARANKLPCPAQSSVPLIEKAYWPFKLELEKFPVGGGGGGPTTVFPPLLQPALTKANSAAANESSAPFAVRRARDCPPFWIRRTRKIVPWRVAELAPTTLTESPFAKEK